MRFFNTPCGIVFFSMHFWTFIGPEWEHSILFYDFPQKDWKRKLGDAEVTWLYGLTGSKLV